MADDAIGEMERFIAPEDDKTGGESPGQSAADILAALSPEAGEAHGSVGDDGDHMPQVGTMPTAQDMESTNASNAEARAKDIADGMDEGTADILNPQFSTPEDMLKIN